ncbi:single-stranded DNA-binding protein, partial [mine drainage metagenome]
VEYVSKGSKVYVEGPSRTEEYTDKEGIKRYTTFIFAFDIQLLSPRNAGSSDGGNQSGTPARSPAPSGANASQRDARPSRQAAPASEPQRSYDNSEPDWDSVPF